MYNSVICVCFRSMHRVCREITVQSYSVAIGSLLQDTSLPVDILKIACADISMKNLHMLQTNKG